MGELLPLVNASQVVANQEQGGGSGAMSYGEALLSSAAGVGGAGSKRKHSHQSLLALAAVKAEPSAFEPVDMSSLYPDEYDPDELHRFIHALLLTQYLIYY